MFSKKTKLTFVRQGLGTLSWTSRGILLSRLGTLSNCRGEAREVAARQEKIKNIIVVDCSRQERDYVRRSLA